MYSVSKIVLNFHSLNKLYEWSQKFCKFFLDHYLEQFWKQNTMKSWFLWFGKPHTTHISSSQYSLIDKTIAGLFTFSNFWSWFICRFWNQKRIEEYQWSNLRQGWLRQFGRFRSETHHQPKEQGTYLLHCFSFVFNRDFFFFSL